MAVAFQLPEPLKGRLEIGDDRHAKHTAAQRYCILLSRKLCCANASAKDSASHALIGNMDECRHVDNPLRPK
jgi:hypothetical protein